MKLIGYILIAFGIFALVMGGISYTDRDKVLDIGPVEASVERRERVPLPPIVGGLALAAGVALLFVGSKKRV